MAETISSTNPNQEIIQSLLAAKIQEIIAVSTIYQYLAKLYPVIATLDSSSMDFENPTETPPLTSSKPLPSTIPETKPEDEIVVANSSTDTHGDLLALLQPMFNSGIIKLVGKPEEQGIIYINLKEKDPFAKTLTKAEYDALLDEEKKVFYFPIIDVNINTECKIPYIFLGDALDRGEFSINCLLQLIYILRKQQDLIDKKIIAKKIFTALLGNHEIAYLFKDYKLIFHENFVAKLPGFIRQEILSIEKKEIVDIISDLMWQNIALFDFCKAIKIKVGTPEEKTFVYSHANLPLLKIKEFLSQTEKLDMDINDIILEDKIDINWSELNKLFKDALKQYRNTDGLLKMLYNIASKSELEEEQRTLYCILSSLCSTRPEECVVDYYYKSQNIINIVGHTMREKIYINPHYILTDTGSSYWFRSNCSDLNTIPSSTSLTQSGNVYMNFYDLLSLKQNTDGKYLVEIIPNTAEKRLIYSTLPITKINTSSEVAEILTPDDYFNFFETTKIDGFNVMSHFSKLKTYFETLSTYKNEDKIKHITKIREIIPIILQKALTKREIEEFQEEFNKKYPYNPAEVCNYFTIECSLNLATLNLDNIKKYCSAMFELLNDDGSYKGELVYVCPEHTYTSSEIFSTLFNTINVSLSITTEIKQKHKGQLQTIFRSNIDNQELRKQAKDQFQKFLKDLEKEKGTPQQTTIFS